MLPTKLKPFIFLAFTAVALNALVYSYMTSLRMHYSAKTYSEGKATILAPVDMSSFRLGQESKGENISIAPYSYVNLQKNLSLFPSSVETVLSFDSGVLNLHMNVKSLKGNHSFNCAANYQVTGHMLTLEPVADAVYCPKVLIVNESSEEEISLVTSPESTWIFKKKTS